MANFRFWNSAKTFWNDIVIGEPTSNQTYTLPATGQQLAGQTDVNSALDLKANTADLKEIGVSQTWQDVTASRAVSVTYTNTTGKPIMINLLHGTLSSVASLYINGVRVSSWAKSTAETYTQTVSAIIPNGATYYVDVAKPTIWLELR